MQDRPSCRACASRYTAHLQDVVGRRTHQRFPQWACLDCKTFFHTSHYKETLVQKEDDFRFLCAEQGNHDKLQNQLFLEIKTRAPHIRTCCEVGHGLGLFMKAARDYGCEPFGFEVNQLCHEFARDQLQLPCELGIFNRDHPHHYDMFASIMVYEHLEAPRDLFATMRDKLNPDGVIYLSVPFIHRREWPYLWTADKSPAEGPPDIFYDNDVHITHFSVEGMRQMGLSLGARQAEYFRSQDTAHHSPGAYHGILFRF